MPPTIAIQGRDKTREFIIEHGKEFFNKHEQNLSKIIKEAVMDPQIEALANDRVQEAYNGVMQNLPTQTALVGSVTAAAATFVAMETINVLGWLYNNTIKSSVDSMLEAREDARLKALADKINEERRLREATEAENRAMDDKDSNFGFTLVHDESSIVNESPIDFIRRNSTITAGL